MAQKADSLLSYPVPNVRKLLIPDWGFELASVDLTGADAQTVAWEANDEKLKRVFKENKIKIHAANALTMFRRFGLKTGYEQPYYDLCRTGVHLCNFLGGDDELAYSMGLPVYEAREFRQAWFAAHPEIQDWHERVQNELMTKRCIHNIWGYERMYFDRVDGILPEGIAWLAQSGTACVCNRAAVNFDAWRTILAGFAKEEDYSGDVLSASKLLWEMDAELLLQVHDELVFQYPQMYRDAVLKTAKPIIHIKVPYDDPLVIPWGLKTSTKSWGQCEKRDWPQ